MHEIKKYGEIKMNTWNIGGVIWIILGVIGFFINTQIGLTQIGLGFLSLAFGMHLKDELKNKK